MSVHHLGFELFQILFSRLAGILQRTALEDDFSRLTKFLLSATHDYFCIATSVTQHYVARRPAIFPGLSGRRKGACSMTSLLSCTTQGDLPPELRQQLLITISSACRLH